VPISRSAIRKLDASITAGMAMMIIKEVTSIDQRNNGMRDSVMPGARYFMIVATSSTATANADTSVNVIICAQKSVRLPGEKSEADSGT
jgi:hypothetical protein